ncbi:MAG TPA: phosphate ABC transporter substrate-binding protein [Gammaproteobacteria bacterium]|nr:phosphate ABC transporter substrate-binding protein [Gammaproteobacteria bacterium]
MKYHFTVSPDFTPEHIPGWFIFNTWMQKALSEVIHLELYDNFESQRKAIQSNEIDIIYANPYDAAFLVREKKFAPLVKPTGKSDEAIIAVHESSPFTCVEDLQPGTRISRTDDPDVNMMSMIMLEPAELDKQNTQSCTRDTYILVAKDLIQGNADIGFFLAEAFHDLSKLVRTQMRALVSSHIRIISHSLLVGPRMQPLTDTLLTALTDMSSSSPAVLESLGFDGWTLINEEEMEFMIDLMDTLE